MSECTCNIALPPRLLRGVTRTVRVTVVDKNDNPVDLTVARNVVVTVALDGAGRSEAYVPGISIQGDDNNVVEFAWYADVQRRCGRYTIDINADFGNRNQSRVDFHREFGVELVEHSCDVSEEPAEAMEVDDDLDLEGTLEVTTDGMSAFDQWRTSPESEGYPPTEEGFFAWMRQPATDAATAAAAQMSVIQGRADEDHTRAGNDHTTASSDHGIAETDHTRAESDHTTAASDHTTAGQDHTTAGTDHTLAAADHTQAGSDHSRAESDHTTAASDHSQAGTDHTRAEGDHTTAGQDHTQAGSDHTTAASDHTTAAADHSQAGTDHATAASDHTIAAADHTQAESDHSRAESDHTVMAGYDTRLGNVESEVSQLGQEVIGKGVVISTAFIGGWNISSSSYSKGDNAKRVGIEEFALDAGDKIVLTDYTKCRMYVGWTADTGAHGAQGWLTRDFTVSVSGVYVVTLEGIPATTLSAVSELTQYFAIVRARSQVLRNAVAIGALNSEAERLDGYLFDNQFIGAGNSFVSKRIYGILPGHKYILNIDKANWDISNIGTGTFVLFNLVAFNNDVQGATLVSYSNAETVPSEIIFTAPASCDSIRVGGRATSGTALRFAIRAFATEVEQLRGFTKGINHRGYCRVAPENTLPAFKLSRQKGFIYVETDLAFTSDGVGVLLHDTSINRTARNIDGTEISGTINIADITYQQALGYDFGIWKGAEYAGTPIPTLEQFLDCCRNIGLKAFIELKAGTQEQVEDCVKLAKSMGVDVVWASFTDTFLSYVIGADAHASVALTCSTISSSVITSAIILRSAGANVFISSSSYGTEAINTCKENYFPLIVWTIDGLSLLKSLNTYISGVISELYDASVVLYEEGLK